MLSNLKFKHKILLGFVVPFSILILSSVYLAVGISHVREDSQKIKNEDLKLAVAAQELRFDVAEVQQWLTDISATRGAEGFDDGYKKAEEYAIGVNKQLDVFQKFYESKGNKKQVELVQKIRADFASYYNVGKEMADKYIKGGPAAGNAFMGNFDKTAEQLDETIRPFIDSHVNEMIKDIDQNDQQISGAVTFFKYSLVFSLVVCSFVVYFLMTSINTINFQFAEIGRFANKLKDGDLTAKVNIDTKDEVGILAQAFNSTMNFIHDAFNSDKIEWSEIALQKQREIEAQEKTKEALKMAEKEKAEAMEAMKVADEQKAKAEQAMSMAAMEKQRAEEFAATEKKAAEELRMNVDKILSVVKAAEAGDLTQEINIGSQDAIGQLAGALDVFFSQLSLDLKSFERMAKELDEKAKFLDQKSHELGKNASETNSLSGSMSTQTQKVIANIRNLNHSTSELKQAVGEISKQASETNRQSANASQHVKDVEGIGRALQQNSDDISQFINIITNIARQTNLLALNATIEAARAGEAGRGFAVVANEVKELARQSAHAAEEITQKVTSIKNNSNELSQSILKVNESMESINAAARIVASATEEQFATTDQFVELIGATVKETDTIGDGSQKVTQSAVFTSNIANESVIISKDLGKSSEQINTLVKKFKLKTNTDVKSKLAA